MSERLLEGWGWSAMELHRIIRYHLLLLGFGAPTIFLVQPILTGIETCPRNVHFSYAAAWTFFWPLGIALSFSFPAPIWHSYALAMGGLEAVFLKQGYTISHLHILRREPLPRTCWKMWHTHNCLVTDALATCPELLYRGEPGMCWPEGSPLPSRRSEWHRTGSAPNSEAAKCRKVNCEELPRERITFQMTPKAGGGGGASAVTYQYEALIRPDHRVWWDRAQEVGVYARLGGPPSQSPRHWTSDRLHLSHYRRMGDVSASSPLKWRSYDERDIPIYHQNATTGIITLRDYRWYGKQSNH